MDHVLWESLLDQSWSWHRSPPLSFASNYPKKSAPKVQPTAPSTFQVSPFHSLSSRYGLNLNTLAPLPEYSLSLCPPASPRQQPSLGHQTPPTRWGGQQDMTPGGKKSRESGQGGQLWEKLEFACPPLLKTSSSFALSPAHQSPAQPVSISSSSVPRTPRPGEEEAAQPHSENSEGPHPSSGLALSCTKSSSDFQTPQSAEGQITSAQSH